MAICPDCQPYPARHLEQWVGDVLKATIIPLFDRFVPARAVHRFAHLLTNTLLALGVLTSETPAALSRINSIAALFVKRAQERGLRFESLRGPFGYINYLRLHIDGRMFEFEVIPRAEFLESTWRSQIIDDKWQVKKHLEQLGAPVLPASSLAWFQKQKAERFAHRVGYPVVLKPRLGSLSQHVYTDIYDRESLELALRRARCYSPLLLAEKQLLDCSFWRVTVVDFENIFVVRREPCSVVGDGGASIDALAQAKSFNGIHRPTLARQGFSLDAVPPKGTRVWLHYKIIAALGADFQEIDPESIPPENRQLFKKIARYFSSRLVGLDFAGEDITKPWPQQACAVLELNSIPNLHLHTFKKGHTEENKVVDALVDLVEKYYTKHS